MALRGVPLALRAFQRLKPVPLALRAFQWSEAADNSVYLFQDKTVYKHANKSGAECV